MTIRIMLDTDDPAHLSLTRIRADILATYADLMNASLLAGLRKDWPQVILIDRGLGDPLGLATVIDVENGTHDAIDAPRWWDKRHTDGATNLTVYSSRAALGTITADMTAGGIHRPYYRWVATLDGTAHIDGYTPGLTPAAVQILGAERLGFHADLSLVLEDAWNPAPAHAAAPPPLATWVGDAAAAARSLASGVDALAAVLEAHK